MRGEFCGHVEAIVSRCREQICAHEFFLTYAAAFKPAANIEYPTKLRPAATRLVRRWPPPRHTPYGDSHRLPDRSTTHLFVHQDSRSPCRQTPLHDKQGHADPARTRLSACRSKNKCGLLRRRFAH